MRALHGEQGNQECCTSHDQQASDLEEAEQSVKLILMGGLPVPDSKVLGGVETRAGNLPVEL